jgi:hypothetical protein
VTGHDLFSIPSPIKDLEDHLYPYYKEFICLLRKGQMFHWILQIICLRNEFENVRSSLPLLPLHLFPSSHPPLLLLSTTQSELIIQAERHSLLHPPSPKFPPPNTILTAPKARPSPLPDLPHHRHARAQSYQYGSIRTLKDEGRPNTADGENRAEAGRGERGVDSPERMGGFSKFYSQ